MATRSRWLGSDVAEGDENFSEHFVNTSDFERLTHSRYVIVSGTKGSGKSALMRALTGDLSSTFSGVYGVLLSDLEFEPLMDDIRRLHDASKHGVVAIARAMWQNVIGILLLEGAMRTKILSEREKAEIRKYLRRSCQLGTQPHEKLASHLERIWNLIDRWSSEEEADDRRTSGLNALSPKQRTLVSSFPHDDRLEHLLRMTLEAIKATNKTFLVCMDGLDSIIESSVGSRDIVFAGLIDAAMKCSSDSMLRGGLELKVLLPHELVYGAVRRLRDLDKIERRTVSIHWDRQGLEEFIRRRLERYSGKKGRPFDEVWKEFFPEKVRNDAHGIDEDVFYYLLRHTLYRPRQLLYHVQWLLDKWDRAEHAPFRLDPTFIPKNLVDHNRRLAGHVIQELSLDFPELRTFLLSFRGVSSVQPWPEVKSRIDRFLGLSETTAENAFADLYNHGIFGINAKPGGGSGRTMRFKFAFMTPHLERNTALALTDKALVAVAPMLKDFCECKTSLYGAVIPVEQV
jgi:hypothetical protein